jgi:hypothetical protein
MAGEQASATQDDLLNRACSFGAGSVSEAVAAMKAIDDPTQAGAQESELAPTRLRELGSKEANYFAQQLVTADRIPLAK